MKKENNSRATEKSLFTRDTLVLTVFWFILAVSLFLLLKVVFL
ncbi:MAG: hypothetical protein SCK29_06970 [Bacillota bacterium]|nr:hypothetical protein [Bacillota bacterium]MDW7683846.1 hypothetical protein [Bacillota bacterium]